MHSVVATLHSNYRYKMFAENLSLNKLLLIVSQTCSPPRLRRETLLQETTSSALAQLAAMV
jgi:hypothetical protein